MAQGGSSVVLTYRSSICSVPLRQQPLNIWIAILINQIIGEAQAGLCECYTTPVTSSNLPTTPTATQAQSLETIGLHFTAVPLDHAQPPAKPTHPPEGSFRTLQRKPTRCTARGCPGSRQCRPTWPWLGPSCRCGEMKKRGEVHICKTKKMQHSSTERGSI